MVFNFTGKINQTNKVYSCWTSC